MQYGFASIVLALICGVIELTSGRPAGSDGSKCPNVSCSPPIPGAQCTPKYERDDGCCPVWYCYQNGATSTIYGKSTGGGSSSSSSFSSQSSSGGGGSSYSSHSSSSGGGFPGFPVIQLPNLANLFG